MITFVMYLPVSAQVWDSFITMVFEVVLQQVLQATIMYFKLRNKTNDLKLTSCHLSY